MTFKEKLKREHPHSVSPIFTGGCFGCPFTYNYERSGEGLCKGRHTSGPECGACWNREMPWPKKNPHLDGLSAKVHLIDELHGVPNLTKNAKTKIKEKIHLDPNDIDVLERLMSETTLDYIKDELGNAYDLQKFIYKMSLNSIYEAPEVYIPEIKKVIFNDPATIVIWSDGEKTVVKCQNGERFDPEKGLAMAITKRALGGKGIYFDEIKKWTKDYEPKKRVWKHRYDLASRVHTFICPVCGAITKRIFEGKPLEIPKLCYKCGSKNKIPDEV